MEHFIHFATSNAMNLKASLLNSRFFFLILFYFQSENVVSTNWFGWEANSNYYDENNFVINGRMVVILLGK